MVGLDGDPQERFELRKLLGAGGMGRVWHAHDRLLHRDVAIKEVTPAAGPASQRQETARRLALSEARAAAQVRHPNAIQIYDVSVTAEWPRIVMEYVPSKSLAEVIRFGGPMTPRHAAAIGLALLDVICSAHRVGVLHRDVKPSNVLIGYDGRVVLTDFGIASWAADQAEEPVSLGTPQYVPPERLRSGLSVPAGDLWGLGATLYAAVEGRSPFARATAEETCGAVLNAPPDPPQRAAELTPVLDGLLRRSPLRRIGPAQVRRRLLAVAHAPRASGARPQGDAGADAALDRCAVTTSTASGPVAAIGGRCGGVTSSGPPSVTTVHRSADHG